MRVGLRITCREKDGKKRFKNKTQRIPTCAAGDHVCASTPPSSNTGSTKGIMTINMAALSGAWVKGILREEGGEKEARGHK